MVWFEHKRKHFVPSPISTFLGFDLYWRFKQQQFVVKMREIYSKNRFTKHEGYICVKTCNIRSFTQDKERGARGLTDRVVLAVSRLNQSFDI